MGSAKPSAQEELPEVTGRVKWFQRARGYGFIVVMDGNSPNDGKEIFVHWQGIIYEGGGSDRVLDKDDLVTFRIIETPKGLEARKVKRLNG
jgi:cold shock CspA family protein